MPARSGYLLDTHVLSETRRRRPDRGVTAFLSSMPPEALFVSVLTLGELRKGVEMKRADDAPMAELLEAWVSTIEQNFSDHVVDVDAAVARIWGELSARCAAPVVDTLIAATAIQHHWTLVTRNTRDMVATGVNLLDPFQREA